MVRAFAHGVMGRRIDPSWNGPMSYFSFQPVLHDWCNKGCGMCYPVYGMVHIKKPLLLIGKSSLCGGSGFLMPYNRKYNVLSGSLNKTLPSFLPCCCTWNAVRMTELSSSCRVRALTQGSSIVGWGGIATPYVTHLSFSRCAALPHTPSGPLRRPCSPLSICCKTDWYLSPLWKEGRKCFI